MKNVKSRPNRFWKYLSEGSKANIDLMQLEISAITTNITRAVAESFSKRLLSVSSFH
jgi:hypothetical protein